MPPKLFSFTQFRKNASATPLVSHTFKTKDLKPFRFTHLQKKGGWRGARRRGSYFPLSTVDCQLSRVSPLDSALTSKRGAKSFTSNTYEKHTGGEGVARSASSASFTSFASSASSPSSSAVLDLPPQSFRSSRDPV